MATLRSLDVDVEIQPLRQWPKQYERRPASERKGDIFHASWDSTLALLNHELNQHGAEDVILQLEVPPDKIRKSDGLPYRNAEIDPGVVLTFTNEEGTHTYPCDTFSSWEVNLRAIANVLEKLRQIERYGVGHGSEQYRGFTALPENVDDRLGPEEAARVLASTAPEARQEVAGGDRDRAVEAILEDRELAGLFYREAAKRSHPDRPDVAGDAHFKRVQRASHVLEQHFSAGGRKTVGAGREADGG